MTLGLGMLSQPSLFKWWSKVDLDLLNVKVKFAYWKSFEKLIFFKTVEALVIILTW